MHELDFGLSVMFVIMAYVSLLHTDELVSTRLGHAIIGGFVLGWVVRAVEGFVFGETYAALVAALCVVAAVLYSVPLVRTIRRRDRRLPNVEHPPKATTPTID